MLHDVAIIGAGVIGCAVARELSRYRVNVAVVEKEADVSFGVTKANSGIVHAGFHPPPGTLKARLCVDGNRLYPVLADELDVPYRRNGAVMAARSPDELPALAGFLERGRQNGLVDLNLIDRAELHRVEPNLAPGLAGALLAPGGGIATPFELAMALAENARANGAVFYLDSPLTRAAREGSFFHLTAGGRTLRARFVINAAGLQAPAVARLLGDDSLSVRPRKGEEYLLDRSRSGFVSRTIFPLPAKVSKGVLVIPTVEGNIMLGPTAEEVDDPDDRATTRAGWREVRARAAELAPGIDARDLIASFAGLRASAPGGDFVIAPSPADPAWINVAGIDSPGLTAAPAIAGYVRSMLGEAGLVLEENGAFHPRRRAARFRSLSWNERHRLIQEDPAFGRVVCRCELVTEAEVIQAVRAGATTLDGVKLRTRAGMGRCQGGFCLPRVLRLIARELDLDPVQVTKGGGGSRLLAGRTRPRVKVTVS